MAENQFDPDKFIAENQVSNIPNVADTQGEQSNFDPDTFLAKIESPVTGDLKPTYADGLSPNTPVNKSPLSLGDRFKMGFGNEKGKLNYLKENFEEATKTKDGNFVVKQDGIWHRVDPTGGGDGDAWEVSKEVIKDVADLGDIVNSIAGSELGIAAGTAAGFKAGAAAGTLVAPGAGTIAGGLAGGVAGFAGGALGGQALATKINTSLGRYFGTYEATPDEQLEEIALESALNLGGAILPAGIKPTGKVIAKALKTASKPFSKMSSGSKRLVTDVLGKTSSVGSENMELAINKPGEISDIMSMALKGGGGEEAARQKIKVQSLNAIAQLADETRTALSKDYSNIVEEIGSKVPSNYRAPTQELSTDVLRQLQDFGVGEITSTAGSKGSIKPFKLFSREEILRRSQQSGNISEFAQSKEGYKAVKDFVDNINILAGAEPKARGKLAFQNLRNLDTSINDSLRQLQNKANDLGLGRLNQSAKQLRSSFRDNFETKVTNSLENPEIRNAYRQLKSTYSKRSEAVKPLLKLQGKRAAGKDPDVEPLLNNLLRRGDKVKFDPDVMRGVLQELGTVNPKLVKTFDRIKTLDAASSFIPKVKGNALVFGAGATSAFYNPALAVGIFAATSPRLAGATARGIGRAQQVPVQMKQQLVKQGFATMNLLRTMSPKQINELASNDEAISQILRMSTKPIQPDIAESMQSEMGGQ